MIGVNNPDRRLTIVLPRGRTKPSPGFRWLMVSKLGEQLVLCGVYQDRDNALATIRYARAEFMLDALLVDHRDVGRFVGEGP